jgi:uncharacterized lipoprotein NlpE involved in copper resistance
MKSIFTLSAITALAALVLVGCNQNTPSSSTDVQSTNSIAIAASDSVSGSTTPPTNNLPNLNTNIPAGTNQ